jgi:hypothetical protein
MGQLTDGLTRINPVAAMVVQKDELIERVFDGPNIALLRVMRMTSPGAKGHFWLSHCPDLGYGSAFNLYGAKP